MKRTLTLISLCLMPLLCAALYFHYRNPEGELPADDDCGLSLAKPVFCLYPETETKVSVCLDLDGELTCTYLAYDGGRAVTAQPNGTLTDAIGQS